VSKALRLLGAVAVAAATVPLAGVAPASAAESVTVTASAQGYFNASAVDKPDAAPAAPPNVATAADGVEPGNLAVAAKGGTEDKVSAILFDLSTLEPGSVVTKAVLTLPLAEGGENLNLSAAPVKVRACGAGDTGFGGEDGSAIALAPARLCDVFSAPAKASPDAKSYVIDITALAATWVDGANDGLTLTAAEGADSTNFQVVFQQATKVAKLAVDYTAGAAVVPAASGVDTSTGSASSPDLGAAPLTPAAPIDSGFGAVSPPVLPDAPVPAPAPAPAAAPAVAPAATAPVALETSMRPTSPFWLGGIVLAAVLVLLSLIMGDANVPQSSRKPSRLNQALTDRRRSTGLGRPSLGRPATI
jgi:hypothetical protein